MRSTLRAAKRLQRRAELRFTRRSALTSRSRLVATALWAVFPNLKSTVRDRPRAGGYKEDYGRGAGVGRGLGVCVGLGTS